MRSRFVHGDLDIGHPLANNILDDRVFHYEFFIYNLAEFGFGIVLAALQRMVKLDWIVLNFKEKVLR